MTVDAMSQLATTLLSEKLDQLALRAFQECRQSESAYRILVPEDVNQQGATETIAFVLHYVADRNVPDHLAEVPERIGAERCGGGVPLDAVLHSFRIDFRVVWDAVLVMVSEQPALYGSDAILSGAGRVWEAIDAVSSRVTDAYRQTEQSVDSQRATLIDALLRGSQPPGLVARQFAAEFGFNDSAAYAVVYAELDAAGQVGIPNPQRALGKAGIRSAWRADSSGQIGVVEVTRDGLAETLQLLEAGARTRVGVGATVQGLAACRGQLWLARTAAHTLPPGRHGVRTIAGNVAAAYAVSVPELSRHLAEDVFAPFEHLSQAESDRLSTTLETYLECDGSVDRTAAALFVHRNTIHQRLKRVHELTGRDATVPNHVVELTLALQARRFGSDGQPAT